MHTNNLFSKLLLMNPGHVKSEVTSSALVGLNAFLASSNLPKDGLSGLHDSLHMPCFHVLFENYFIN